MVCRANSSGRVLSASYCNPYKPFVGLSDLAPNFSVSYPGNKPASDLLSLFLASVCNDIATSTCGIPLQDVTHIQVLTE